MARLNFELKGATDQASALVETLRIVGVPIIYATVAPFFVRRGDAGDEMYVLIQGAVDVHAGSSRERGWLTRYGRGEVFWRSEALTSWMPSLSRS